MEYLSLYILASLHCSSAIPLDEFYSFGEIAEDSNIGPTLDSHSDEFRLSRTFPFFSSKTTSLFVSYKHSHIFYSNLLHFILSLISFSDSKR